MDGVVITGNFSPRSKLRRPTTVSSNQIQNRGARGTTDLLSTLPKNA